jgi:predicted RNase H-like HicB family nuclease
VKAYLAFINEDRAGFGVVFPDLPGCVSVGDGFEDAVEQASEALALYAEAVRAGGNPLPEPRTLKQIEKAKLDWIEPGYVVAAIPLIAPRKQTTRVNIALDQSELDAIDQAAKRSGVDRSTYMVRAALFAAAPGLLRQETSRGTKSGLAESAKPFRRTARQK